MGDTVDFSCTIDADMEDLQISWELTGPEAMSASIPKDEVFTAELLAEGEYTLVASAQGPCGSQVRAEHTLLVVSPKPPDPSSEPPDVPPDSTTLALRLVSRVAQALPAQGFTTIGAGDLSGDGVPDLVAGSSCTTRIVLFQGRPDGTYHERLTVSAGIKPNKLLVADVTGNSWGDIVAVNWSTGQATLLLSEGPFELSAPSSISMPSQSWGVWAGKLTDKPATELIWLTENGPMAWSFLEGDKLDRQPPLTEQLSYPGPQTPLFDWVQFNGSFTLLSYDRDQRYLTLTALDRATRVIAEFPSGVSLLSMTAARGPEGIALTLIGLDQLGRLHTLHFSGQ